MSVGRIHGNNSSRYTPLARYAEATWARPSVAKWHALPRPLTAG
jgi:hypothetical protein